MMCSQSTHHGTSETMIIEFFSWRWSPVSSNIFATTGQPRSQTKLHHLGHQEVSSWIKCSYTGCMKKLHNWKCLQILFSVTFDTCFIMYEWFNKGLLLLFWQKLCITINFLGQVGHSYNIMAFSRNFSFLTENVKKPNRALVVSLLTMGLYWG